MAGFFQYSDYAPWAYQGNGGDDGGSHFVGVPESEWNNLTDAQRFAAISQYGQFRLNPRDPRYAAIAQSLGTNSGRDLWFSGDPMGSRGYLNDPNAEYQGDGFYAHAEDNQTPGFQQLDDQNWNWGALIGTPLAFMGAGLLAGAGEGGMGYGTMTGAAGDESLGLAGTGSYAGAGGAGTAGGAAGAGGAGAATGTGGGVAGTGLTAGQLFNGARTGLGLASMLGGGAGGMGGGGMAGSGGGGGSVRYEWSDQMRPRWESLLDQAAGVAGQPYTPYGGQRVAPLSQDEQNAQAYMRHFVGDPGSFLYGQGNQFLQDTLGGKYLNSDPYAGQMNPFIGRDASVGKNEYGGENAYFRSQLGAGMRDITDAYKNAIAPDISAQAVLNGTFGGGDHLKAQSNAQDQLAKRLGDFSSGMYSQQFDRSANLREADIARNLQNSQFGQQLGGNLYDAMLSRGSGAYQQERGRQMGAAPLSQNDQALTLQRYQALAQMGALGRGIDQANNDVGYQDYLDARGWDRNNLQFLGGMYGMAQGGQMASPQQGPTGFSNAMNWLGVGSAGLGLYRSLGGMFGNSSPDTFNGFTGLDFAGGPAYG